MEYDQAAALQSLSSDYLSLLGSGSGGGGGGELGLLSDVTFCMEGRQVPAHRCILAARSHFFRLLFSQHQQSFPNSHQLSNSNIRMPPPIATTGVATDPLIIPVDVVGFNAFTTVLRFLYSGQLILSQIHRPATPSSCPSPSCQHVLCSYAIDLLLELIHAAHFFGINDLCDLVETKLSKVLEEGVSIESLMRVLVIAKRHRLRRIWPQCADLIVHMGLGCDALRKYLPAEVISELATDTRLLQRSASYLQHNMTSNNVAANTTSDRMAHSPPKYLINSPNSHMNCSINGSIGGCCSEEQRIVRLQQALDCMDVELVRLMVMGEGLDLDKALALHYSVANCNREVVKALLELGIVDVNYSDSMGRTALHLAAGMGNAEMIAVLLDHHANPNAVTHEGFASIDILRSLMKVGVVDHTNEHQHLGLSAITPQLCKADQKRLHLCIELLQSAAAVVGRDDVGESSCVTQAATQHCAAAQLNVHHYIERSLIRPNFRGNADQINNDQLKASRAPMRADSFTPPGPAIGVAAVADNHGGQPITTPSQHKQEAAHDGSLVLMLDHDQQYGTNKFSVKEDIQHGSCTIDLFSSISTPHDYHQILEHLQPHNQHPPQKEKTIHNTGSSSDD
ncbi:hypothetical protein GOP47_0028413 [Adiantum capillus-veneris]|nr:hypothetical protein GOP47_0028413 [Adiantum capillus-veneris]